MKNSSPKYDQVREAFSERAKETRKYIQENVNFCSSVTHGFAKYLGMPQSYEFTKDGQTTYPSYTPMYEIENDEMLEVAHWTDAITNYSDGKFDFGLGIVLEPAANAWPKEVLRAKVECERNPRSVLVKIADKKIEVKFDGTDSPEIEKVHQLIESLLNEWLASRWGGTSSEGTIGFQLARPQTHL